MTAHFKLKEGILKNLNRHIKYIYVFKCNVFKVVKIGISSDPIKRLKRLNEEAESHKFQLLWTKEFETSESCRAFEKYLHDHFCSSRVITGRYGGYTETFGLEIIDELNNILKTFTTAIKRIDPYLTLKFYKSSMDCLPEYKKYKDIYRMIFADLYMAKLNGFSCLYCSRAFACYTMKRTRYLYTFKLIADNGFISCEKFENILQDITLDDILIFYKDSMLDFIKKVPVTSVIYTLSIMEYFMVKRDRIATFRRILKSRGLTLEEIDAMQVAYKQVMKTDMNCRLEVK